MTDPSACTEQICPGNVKGLGSGPGGEPITGGADWGPGHNNEQEATDPVLDILLTLLTILHTHAKIIVSNGCGSILCLGELTMLYSRNLKISDLKFTATLINSSAE